jgi:ATP-dependent RNA helicase DDX31/DBP7
MLRENNFEELTNI